MFATYDEVLDYLYAQLPMYSRIGAAAYKDDLDNTLALCKVLNNPEKKQKFIHIAGTNGKGSTSHMLAAILQSAGYKTGLYTSPHLKDFRERIRINGEKISKDYILEFVNQYRQPFEEIQPSFFEWTVGLCFKYFADEKTDVAVIETGLGGRLDSTNVIMPLLSVITNIGYDHMDMLGNTLPKIALEKAGIIKPSVPVVIGETDPETHDVFTNRAMDNASSITFADKQYIAEKIGRSNTHLICNVYHNKNVAYKQLELELQGDYQLKNVCTVLAAIDSLRSQGLSIPDDAIYTGLAQTVKLTGLHGRWDVLQTSPLVVADIAHNKSGIAALMESVKSTSHRHLHIIIGFVREKDIHPILSLLPPYAHYYFTQPSVPRKLPVEELVMAANSIGLKGKAYDDVNTALDKALQNSFPNDMVLICGSNFVIADLKSLT